jgi:hypothetical protein
MHIVALILAFVLQQSALVQVKQGFIQVRDWENLLDHGLFH